MSLRKIRLSEEKKDNEQAVVVEPIYVSQFILTNENIMCFQLVKKFENLFLNQSYKLKILKIKILS